MKPPFRTTKDGRIEVTLDEQEVDFLSDLPDFLTAVTSDPDDPAARRLDVPAYLDDPEANADFKHYMADELDMSRHADRAAFSAVMARIRGKAAMDLEEAHAVLRVLVESRLALGARFGLDVEDDYERLPEEQGAVLEFLAYLQVHLIEAVSPW